MELTSPAFDTGGLIPEQHTHKGAASSPPLMISGTPPGTQSLALVMHDPGAPNGDFTHWTLWNISATASVLPENHIPSGALQGRNDYGEVGYGAPTPPSGSHKYVFDLYALNVELALTAGADLEALLAAMEGHIVAQAQLVGTVSV